MLRGLLNTTQRLTSLRVFRPFAAKIQWKVIPPRGSPRQLAELCEKPTFASFKTHMEWLQKSLSGLSPPQLSSLLLAAKAAENEDFSMSTELGASLAYEVVDRVKMSQKFLTNLLTNTLDMKPTFEKAGVEVTEILKIATRESFVPSKLEHISLKSLSRVLSAYGNVDEQTKKELVTASGEELITSVEKHINMIKCEQASTIDLAYLLASLLKFEKSSESILRNLEQNVLSRFAELDNTLVVRFPSFYKRRVRSDSEYMISKVMNPYFAELLRRGRTLTPNDLSVTFGNLWVGMSNSGCYQSPHLLELISTRATDSEWLRGNCEYLLRSTMFLANISSSPSLEVLSTLATTFSDESTVFNNLSSIQMACSLAKTNVFLPEFWDRLSVDTVELQKNKLYQVYFYSLLLTLATKKPELHTRLSQEVQWLMPDVTAAWVGQLGTESRKPLADIVEKVLREKQVDFTRNHICEFLLDFAIPSKKIAIELCQLRDYEIPNNQLNGRIHSKHLILKQLGWNVVAIPTHTLTPETVPSALQTLLDPLLT